MKLNRMTGISWLALWVVVGLGLRLIHYVRSPSIWHDEAALIINVIDLDFARLLGPLLHSEAAPPLFLWLERAILLLFGDTPTSLRLLPFAASCLALVLFADAARRVIPIQSACWAVAMFACSDRQLWHACEAKPYAIDVLVGVAILRGWLLMRGLSVPRQCLLWLPWMPVMLLVSYPACFMVGGLLTVLAMQATRERSRAGWFALAGLSIAVAGCFLWVALGPARAQKDGAMLSCWVSHFPDWSRPWKFPFWTLFSTMEVVRYNLMPFGQAATAFVVVGAWVTVRRGRASLAVLTLLPLGLAWVASCAGAYPYGGSRVEAFASGGLILMVGASLQPTLSAIRRHVGRPWEYRLICGLSLFLLLPVAQGVARTIVPWPRADCDGAAEYVRSLAREGDLVSWNHWEYEYYFRNRRGQYIAPEAVPAANDTRVWVIVTGDRPEDRDDYLRAYADRDFHDRREFVRTTVVLLD